MTSQMRRLFQLSFGESDSYLKALINSRDVDSCGTDNTRIVALSPSSASTTFNKEKRNPMKIDAYISLKIILILTEKVMSCYSDLILAKYQNGKKSYYTNSYNWKFKMPAAWNDPVVVNVCVLTPVTYCVVISSWFQFFTWPWGIIEWSTGNELKDTRNSRDFMSCTDQQKIDCVQAN